MPDAGPHAAIAGVVRLYVEGMCGNGPAKRRAAMHERGCSIGHFESTLEWETREGFLAQVQAAVTDPDPAPRHSINAITVIGDMATVQVEDIPLGQHDDDTLTLLWHEGRWPIVAKVFCLRPEGSGAAGGHRLANLARLRALSPWRR
jgi:hypothetical protein